MVPCSFTRFPFFVKLLSTSYKTSSRPKTQINLQVFNVKEFQVVFKGSSFVSNPVSHHATSKTFPFLSINKVSKYFTLSCQKSNTQKIVKKMLQLLHLLE